MADGARRARARRMPGLGQLSKEAAERKLKEGISGHRTGLPKKLLEFFEPRDALEFKPPPRKRPPKVRAHGPAPAGRPRAAARLWRGLTALVGTDSFGRDSQLGMRASQNK